MSEEPTVTLQTIREAMEQTWERMEAILPQIGEVLDAGANDSGWNPRQLLSHLVGSWQRVPLHTAFILDHIDVPIQVGDPFWIPEWDSAPLSAFRACLEAGYDSSVALVNRIEPSDLSIVARTPFGETTLGEFLMLSYSRHLDAYHMPQLESFAAQG